jgi:hypothetical protein
VMFHGCLKEEIPVSSSNEFSELLRWGLLYEVSIKLHTYNLQDIRNDIFVLTPGELRRVYWCCSPIFFALMFVHLLTRRQRFPLHSLLLSALQIQRH